MINDYNDYIHYLEADRRSLGITKITIKMKLKSCLIGGDIWTFQWLLRKCEYLHNLSSKNFKYKILFKFYNVFFQRLSIKLGFTIPFNVCGPGLCLAHRGTIIINDHCIIGSNAHIHADVNIGNFSKYDENWVPDNAPVIGDNCYIGPGAKLFGRISIGDNVAIGANAVVNHDIPDHVTVAGVPAKIINYNGSINMIHYGEQNLNKIEKN